MTNGTKMITMATALAATMLTFAAAPTNSYAGAKEKARAWCSQYERTSDYSCSVEKCPCGVGQKKLKKFKRKGPRRGYCACGSRSAKRDLNRQKAEAACRDYRTKYSAECVVTRGHCPVGKIPIATYRGGPLVKYKACRAKSSKIERLRKGANKMRPILTPHAMPFIRLYKDYFRVVMTGADRPTQLPLATRRTLQGHYKHVNLDKVRIAHSPRKTGKGCVTDCHTIYCDNKHTIAAWRKGSRIGTLLLHELAHTEQCSKWGGRNNYAVRWWRGVARAGVKRVKGGNLHDNQPMEKEAEQKAQRVCKTLGPAC